LLGIRKDIGRRVQETDITLCGGPAVELQKALEEGTFLHSGPVKKHGGPFTGNYGR
jgi:hypothetical protein